MQQATFRKLMLMASGAVIGAAMIGTPVSAQGGRDRDAGNSAHVSGELRSGQRGDVQIRAGERVDARMRSGERGDARIRSGARSEVRIRAGDRENTRVRVSERSRFRSDNVRVGARVRETGDRIAVRNDRYVVRDDWRDEGWRYRRDSWGGPAVSFSVGNGYYGPYYDSSYAHSGPYAYTTYSEPYYPRDTYYGYAAAPGCTCARDWRWGGDSWNW